MYNLVIFIVITFLELVFILLLNELLLFCCQVMFDSFAAPWTVSHQAPLSMGFSRQEYWSGLLFLFAGDLPNPGIEPLSPVSPAWQVNSLLLSYLGSPLNVDISTNNNLDLYTLIFSPWFSFVSFALWSSSAGPWAHMVSRAKLSRLSCLYVLFPETGLW